MRNLLVIAMLLVCSAWTLGQQNTDTPKPVSPAAIKLPEPEATKIKELEVKAEKARETFTAKIKPAQEVFQAAIKAPTAEYEKEMAALQAEYDKLLVEAGAKSGIGLSELGKLQPDTKTGTWVKKPEAPKEK